MIKGWMEKSDDAATKKLVDKLTDSLPKVVLVPVRGTMMDDTNMAERIQKVHTWMDEKGYDFSDQSRGFNLATLSFKKRE